MVSIIYRGLEYVVCPQERAGAPYLLVGKWGGGVVELVRLGSDGLLFPRHVGRRYAILPLPGAFREDARGLREVV
jgi:hypothetical protein